MQIVILTVPNCPSATTVLDRVREALAGRPARLELHEIHDQAEAERLGMSGSPTVLVNGADPFGASSEGASVSCRLYRRPDGVGGAPTVSDLQAAIAAAFADQEAGG
ncbi:MAG TPA: DsbA family protein [Sporichthya sp.]|nr:DsbA family protein [Sporichthya sp.]